MLLAELATLFRRLRIKTLLAVLAAIPAALALAVYLSGGPSAGRGPTFLDQVSHNGMFAALTGLFVIQPFFLPLATGLFAGDSIAGEAQGGTLRYLLIRPVPRGRLVLAKYASAMTLLATMLTSACGMPARCNSCTTCCASL